MLTRLLLAALCAALVAVSPVATGFQNKHQTDLLLVLATDVSGSITEAQFDLQRKGYAEAVTDPQVLRAIRSGPKKHIALAYVEWSGSGQAMMIAGWSLINDNHAAQEFAATIMRTRRPYTGSTHIGRALQFCVERLEQAPFAAERRIIDVSGDGEDDDTTYTNTWRDRAVRKGVVINGLVVVPKQAYNADVLNQTKSTGERYYRANVTGGPGSFVMTADGYESFGTSIRKKLIAEVASR